MQLRNPLDRHLGNGGSLRGKHVHKFTLDMGHASHIRGFILAKNAIEASITIRMDPGQIAGRVFDRVAVQGRLSPTPKLGTVTVTSVLFRKPSKPLQISQNQNLIPGLDQGKDFRYLAFS